MTNKVENFDLKESGTGTAFQIPTQSFHRERSPHTGRDSEEPEGGGNHHRHCGSVREV